MRKIVKSEIEIKQSNVLEKWAKQYPEVTNWLGKIQAKKHSAYHLFLFCHWSEKAPAELLALKDDPASKEAELLLNKFAAQEVGVPESAKFNISIAVRSFFKHNFKDLAKAAGVVEYEKVKPYWKPNKDDLRRLYRFCANPRDRSILTLVCSSAIAKESLSKLKWKHLEDNWQEQETPHIGLPSRIIKGHGRGKYKGVEQHTFLTPEAKRDLIEYRQWMEKKLGREFEPNDNVYWTVDRPFKPLSYKGIGRVFSDLSKVSEIGFSPHDARRYVETALEEIRINPNWARKIRGRKVKGEESPYSQPNIKQLREKYREAVPLLEFTSGKREIPNDVKERLRALEEEQRRLRAEYYRKDVSKPMTETNGGGEFRQVSETELLGYLEQGWQIVHKLKGMEVIVKR